MIGYFIGFAILNGVIIGLSRALNGRLGIGVGVLRASLWNHIVGFAFLTLLLISLSSDFSWQFYPAIPPGAFFGGVIGAIFVAANSYVFPKLGAARTILMVTSGQLMFGVLLDYKTGQEFSTVMQLIGIGVILLGVCLDKDLGLRVKYRKNKVGVLCDEHKKTVG